MRAASAILAVVGVAVVACDSHEPSAAYLAAQFERQRASFEQLRVMFDSDVKAVGLRQVSVMTDQSASCEEHSGGKCLSADRWNVYADAMRRIGVQFVSRESGPDRTYFIMYARTYLMNGRFRGVVHTAAAPVEVASAAQREDWKAIAPGWHSCLLVDD